MRKYAEGTTVTIDKSRMEIERTLERYGAEAFRYSKSPAVVIIEFAVKDRHIRFTLPMPNEAKFYTPRMRESETMRLWRSLAMSIKSKLEVVSSGISQFEREFLAYTVDPTTNRTVGEVLLPQLEQAYESGEHHPLLLTHEKQ